LAIYSLLKAFHCPKAKIELVENNYEKTPWVSQNAKNSNCSLNNALLALELI
jgi:hypothetical protein